MTRRSSARPRAWRFRSRRRTGQAGGYIARRGGLDCPAAFSREVVLRVSAFEHVRLHLRHHSRFYGSALFGVLVWAALGVLAPSLRLVAAGDCFFGAYLAAAALFVLQATPEDMRLRARYADEGTFIIVLVTLVGIVLSLWSMFGLLGIETRIGAFRFGLTLASVVLGWLTLHTILAIRYAHLYYARAASDGAARQDARGLEFPSTKEPMLSDFVYFSFVIGTTAQVSDVQVLTSRLRRLIMFHSVVSFFFNTVLLALAINLAAAGLH